MAAGRVRPSPSRVRTAKRCYHIVKVEAGPESVFKEVPCRVCGAPLAGRDGRFVLKYFLLREATQKKAARIEKPQRTGR